jgi:hypothetical protein
MSNIYKNFGVDFDTNKSNNSYKIISKTGEELNINPEVLQIKQLTTQANTVKNGLDGYKIEQVFADFKSAGLTDKLANFYTITLKEIADSTEVDVLSLYTKEDNKISISNDVLNLINNTLPNSVRFQNSVNTTSDKYVRLLIGA